MVRVIIGHKAKTGMDIEPILLKLRTHAMQYPGFVAFENLLGESEAILDDKPQVH